MSESLQLVKYDAMCRAIEVCHSVDEAKDIRDKALAWEVYLRQAENTEAEHKAAEIRIRAERRAGELLKEMKETGQRSNGGRGGSSHDTTTLPELGISRDQASKWQQLAEIPDHQFESSFRDPEIKPSTEGVLRRSNPLMSSNSDEWNSPPHVVVLVEKVLGRIDLDPCCNDGEPNVKAKKLLRRADDGLKHDWKGRVYMNPPYGDAVGDWVEKLVSEHVKGNAKEAIALVAARVDTKWFRKFEPFTICFISGRLKFGDSDNSATFPSAAIYLGGDMGKFVKVFSNIGWCPNMGAVE